MLLTTLAHTSVDAFFVGQFFNASIVGGTSTLPFVTGVVPVALLLVIATRGCLSYEHCLPDDEAPVPAAPGG